MPKRIKIKVKQQELKDSAKFRIKTDTAESTNNKKIVFSFENFGKKTHGFDCEATEFKALIKHLKILSSMTWQEIQEKDRHKLGSETIKKSQLAEQLPLCYSDKDTVLAFRYNGKKPLVAIRKNEVLDILFLDPNFDLYDHS